VGSHLDFFYMAVRGSEKLGWGRDGRQYKPKAEEAGYLVAPVTRGQSMGNAARRIVRFIFRLVPWIGPRGGGSAQEEVLLGWPLECCAEGLVSEDGGRVHR
jgi:hypothetical protein